MKNILHKTLFSIWASFVTIYFSLATIEGGKYRIHVKNVEGIIKISLGVSIIVGFIIFLKCIKDIKK